MPHLAAQLFLLVILLALSAFFSGSETAVFSLSKLEKKRLSQRHPRAWKTISKLLDRPRRTLITILIGNMIVNTMAIAIATTMATEWLGPQGVGWTIAVFTFILVITGELTPKVFTVRNNELFACLFAIPLDWIARLIFPVRRLIRLVSDRILFLIVPEKKKADADLISESELKALARIGEEEGALNAEERNMIQKLINLGDRIVREIMTPRTEMVSFNMADGREKMVQLVKQFHHSYFPVYEKSHDNILGVISTREFMLDRENRLRELIVPPEYVPETKPIDELLQEFQARKSHVAICVDEYGGTAGLVTLEDVLEEIFGEFYDEYAKPEPLVKAVGEDVFLVHAKVALRDLNEAAGLSLSSQTSETLNGWLLEQFGRIPKTNEVLRFEGCELHVKEVFRQRILKVEIRKKR
jgi:putative hemolysin